MFEGPVDHKYAACEFSLFLTVLFLLRGEQRRNRQHQKKPRRCLSASRTHRLGGQTTFSISDFPETAVCNLTNIHKNL